VGFKPSFGLVPTGGLIPLARSLDHVGVIARSVADCRLFQRACAQDRRLKYTPQSPKAPRLAVAWQAAERCAPDVRDNFARAVGTLRAAGADLRDAEPLPLDAMLAAHRIVMQAEATALHDQQLRLHRLSYRPLMRAFVESGRMVPAVGYLRALSLRGHLTHQLVRQFSTCDAVLLPSVPDEAPGIETTGDASLLSPFSLAGTPAITLPSGLSTSRLPLGIQLVGAPGGDFGLLDTAEWCENQLGRGLRP
jgi:aspartyl-tRNA(Asn)/glutamyl-tRNA(Gln) amidotransferase subunit A